MYAIEKLIDNHERKEFSINPAQAIRLVLRAHSAHLKACYFNVIPYFNKTSISSQKRFFK